MLMPLRLIYTWYPSLARSSEDASSVVQRLILNWLLRCQLMFVVKMKFWVRGMFLLIDPELLELRVFLRIRSSAANISSKIVISLVLPIIGIGAFIW